MTRESGSVIAPAFAKTVARLSSFSPDWVGFLKHARKEFQHVESLFWISIYSITAARPVSEKETEMFHPGPDTFKTH